MASRRAQRSTDLPIVWAPQPGPQAKLITCPVFEIAYGGARGGGKTAGMIGRFAVRQDNYGADCKGIFFRRELPQLEAAIDYAKQVYLPLGAEWHEQKKTFTFPSGASLKFRPLERDTDAEKYQGHDYCVGVDTPVLMASGEWKPIRDVAVGDSVATLEGPRKVKRVTAPYLAPCVLASVRAWHGGLIAQQIHPVWHPVYSSAVLSGSHTATLRRILWRCVRVVRAICTRDAGLFRGIDLKTLGWFAYSVNGENDCKGFERKHRESGRFLLRCVPVTLHEPGFLLTKNLAHVSRQPAILSRVLGRCVEWWQGWRSSRKVVCAGLALPRLPGLLVSDNCGPCLSSGPQGERHGLNGAASFRAGYHGERGLDGGQPLARKEIGQGGIPLQAGAAGRFRAWLLGALGTIRKYIHPQPGRWAHPYTGEARRLVGRVRHGTVDFVPYGDSLVCDLTVDGANHYITPGGLVNKNTDVFFEELTNYPDPAPYQKLKATLRSAAGVPVHICSTSNPGGPGHHWVKARFIDPAPQGFKVLTDEQGLQRVFIPARVSDNQLLLQADPTYVARLKQTGSASLVRAWLDGDWSVIEGAFFDQWSERLILRPFEVPKDWTRFRAFDWGSARPFSVGWWAIVPDDFDAGGQLIPKGALICYREWYGASAPNVGLKLAAEDVAAGVREREQGETMAYGVADPAVWIADGGPSIAERMLRAGVTWRPADNKRIAGWDQVRQRIAGIDGRPLIYWFSTCVDSIRSIPALQHDTNKPEDVDTDGDDHCGDQVRYACMSRPLSRPIAEPPHKPKSQWELRHLLNQADQEYSKRKRI